MRDYEHPDDVYQARPSTLDKDRGKTNRWKVSPYGRFNGTPIRAASAKEALAKAKLIRSVTKAGIKLSRHAY